MGWERFTRVAAPPAFFQQSRPAETLEGRTAYLGTSYEYLTAYAERLGKPVEKAVFSLLREIEGVLGVILFNGIF